MSSSTAGITARDHTPQLGPAILSPGTAPIKADVVFVHGLLGDNLGSWTKDGVVWPRDLLPEDLENARIITWGYNADIETFFQKTSQSSLFSHALSLLQDIQRERKGQAERARPLIFVGHSLGGLVIKQALCKSHEYDVTGRSTRMAAIIKKTFGIVFVGTPHRGSEQNSWASIATNLAKEIVQGQNDHLVRALTRGSDVLEGLLDSFAGIHDRFTIYSALEEQDSFRSGKTVDDTSASLGFKNETVFWIPAKHMDMCRFSTRGEIGYKRLVGSIEDLIEDSSTDETVDQVPSVSPMGRASPISHVSHSPQPANPSAQASPSPPTANLPAQRPNKLVPPLPTYESSGANAAGPVASANRSTLQLNGTQYSRSFEDSLGTLPPGWERREDWQGRVHYVDHSARDTTWVRPLVPYKERDQRIQSEAKPTPKEESLSERNAGPPWVNQGYLCKAVQLKSVFEVKYALRLMKDHSILTRPVPNKEAHGAHLRRWLQTWRVKLILREMGSLHFAVEDSSPDSLEILDLLLEAMPPSSIEDLGFADTVRSINDSPRNNDNGRIFTLRGDAGAAPDALQPYTPLSWAAALDNDKAVRKLLDAGAEIDSQRNVVGNTALMTQCILNPTPGNQLSSTAMLLHAGASVTLRESMGYTALHNALYMQNWELAKILIRVGAPVSASAGDGCTPLHVCVARGDGNECMEMIRFLLEQGAEKEVRDLNGLTPFGQAEGLGNYRAISILRQYTGNATAISAKTVPGATTRTMPSPSVTSSIGQELWKALKKR